MFGRSALKTPWLAKLYKEYVEDDAHIDETYLLFQRKNYLDQYFDALLLEYREIGWADNLILKRFKSFSVASRNALITGRPVVALTWEQNRGVSSPCN